MYTKLGNFELKNYLASTSYQVHDGQDTRSRFYTTGRLDSSGQGPFRARTPIYVRGVPYYETCNNGRSTMKCAADLDQIYEDITNVPAGSIILCPPDLTTLQRNPEVFIKNDHQDWYRTDRFELQSGRLVDLSNRSGVREYVGVKSCRSFARDDQANVEYSVYRVTGENVCSFLQHLAAHVPVVYVVFGTNIWDEEPAWVKDANDVLQGEFA